MGRQLLEPPIVAALHVQDKDERKILHCRRWFLWIPIIVCGSLLYYFDIRGEIRYHLPMPNTIIPDPVIPKVKSGFLVDNEGCRIPDLDAFDPLVRKFISKENPINCSNKVPLLVDSNITSLFIIDSVLPEFNVSDADQLNCCYQPFWRTGDKKDNTTSDIDDGMELAENCTSFKNAVTVPDEFVRVICSVDGEEIYRNYHAFVPIKPEVEKRCKEVNENISTSGKDFVNVLILGIDAVSRLNMHRQMPRTIDALHKFGAIEFMGFNKIGDNTFPNMIAVLSGLTEKELESTCWPESKTVFDNCPWIWKNFSAAGYTTAFGEDAVWMGLFNYQKKGFAKQPTDYYSRPFIKLAEDDIGHTKPLNAKLCAGSKLVVSVLLEYVSKFAITMKSKKSFSFFWTTSLTHDFLNYPKLGDSIYESFLTTLSNSGVLNNTLLIVMSDHGIRWGGIRETYQGRLEERLPFVFFVFPQWFKERYHTAVGNIYRNTRCLTTHYDLYETLLDLLNLDQLEQSEIRRRSDQLSAIHTKPRAISLFLPVHKKRTCAEAGIDSHWCTCQLSKSLSTSDKVVKKMSLFLLRHINELLIPYGECAKLHLAGIKSASVEYPMDVLHKTKGEGITDYTLVIQTIPGDALLEGTVRHHSGKNDTHVAGVVSRINKYGDQSICISDFHMKLYCYCKSYLKG